MYIPESDLRFHPQLYIATGQLNSVMFVKIQVNLTLMCVNVVCNYLTNDKCLYVLYEGCIQYIMSHNASLLCTSMHQFMTLHTKLQELCNSPKHGTHICNSSITCVCHPHITYSRWLKVKVTIKMVGHSMSSVRPHCIQQNTQ